MGQSITVLDKWAQNKLHQPFTWGVSDCHWLMYDFLKIWADWKDPDNYAKLFKTYSDRRGANRVAEGIDVLQQITDLGYTQVNRNTVETGDIICVSMLNDKYDLWMPVVSRNTLICGDALSKEIRLKNIADLKPGYKQYRKV